MILDGSFRLYLTFREGFNKVEVMVGAPAATRQIDEPVLRTKGTIGRAEELESLLDAANIDYAQVALGDPSIGSASTAVACTPESIVEDLKVAFDKANPPKSLTVYASSVPTAQGEERVAAWFKNKASSGQTKSTSA